MTEASTCQRMANAEPRPTGTHYDSVEIAVSLIQAGTSPLQSTASADLAAPSRINVTPLSSKQDVGRVFRDHNCWRVSVS